jgi:hypothetical protein
MKLDIFEVLTVIFITLKVIGIGDIAKYNWFIVLSPMWAGMVYEMFMFRKKRAPDLRIEINRSKKDYL